VQSMSKVYFNRLQKDRPFTIQVMNRTHCIHKDVKKNMSNKFAKQWRVQFDWYYTWKKIVLSIHVICMIKRFTCVYKIMNKLLNQSHSLHTFKDIILNTICELIIANRLINGKWYNGKRLSVGTLSLSKIKEQN
jgi:hypothetical protein